MPTPRRCAPAWQALAAACALAALVDPAAAQMSPAAQRGLTSVRTHCAQCHSIDKVTESPLRVAIPLRDVHRLYPVENLAESLGEGIRTGHPSMPEYQLDPGQVADVIAWLKTLE
jgi:mono/diheme cytochrome c family protein